jgi:putative ABC transport system substrate-binding protein
VIDRRTFLAGTGAVLLAAPLTAEAQPPDRIARIGCLGIDLAADPANRDVFLQSLRALGYVEGRNLAIEYRDAKGKPERFPALAAELAALKVDVIVTFGGTAAALGAKQATRIIPIVFLAVGDPVPDGLVASLARPGGNVTGLSLAAPELVGKWLELLKQAVPGVNRTALLLKRDAAPDPTIQAYLKAGEGAASSLGMQLQVVEARGPEDFDRAFADMSKARAGALAVVSTPVFNSARRRLVEQAARNRLPSVYSLRMYVDAGGLMSYGPDVREMARRGAAYVDKILKGAKPADLPVEQPTKFELVINLKTAKALGLTIPPSLLGRADEVVQ